LGEDAPQPVASYRHSALFLVIVAVIIAAGYLAQQSHTPGGELVDSHAQAIPAYLSVIALDWLLVLFVWRGIRHRGISFGSLIQGRWANASAGFCEEFVFRGYVQRQLLALSRNTVVAVLGQGVVFGMMHAYQGWVPAARIVVIGVLFGAFAAWRRTLRVGMVAHAWQDIWAGWLGRVLLRA